MTQDVIGRQNYLIQNNDKCSFQDFDIFFRENTDDEITHEVVRQAFVTSRNTNTHSDILDALLVVPATEVSKKTINHLMAAWVVSQDLKYLKRLSELGGDNSTRRMYQHEITRTIGDLKETYPDITESLVKPNPAAPQGVRKILTSLFRSVFSDV